ncbi:MAG: DUF444 family protein [Chloroflexi bacterium]|nr:DUF444 family protein [Chloroflexota bacterium]
MNREQRGEAGRPVSSAGPFHYSLVHEPWDFHRRSRRDILRHNERVREAIKANLPEIISQEDIVTTDGQKIVKVPLRGVELPRFRFDPYLGRQAGQGDEGTRGQAGAGQPNAGRTRPGTILGGTGAGSGKEAGHEPGVDYYEAEITVDELVDMALEDLGLPDLKEKGKEQVVVTSVRYDTIRKVGPQANLDARRTLIEAYKRTGQLGAPGWQIDPTQDPRYRSWEESVEPQRNAVVLAMRDVSGSIGDFEAYLCRTFYTWMVRFLRRRYAGVEVVFITCHTEAQEVDEEAFFHQGSSGGTRMASAYALALKIIGQRFDPSAWNIYPFLFSDGDNWDDQACVELVRRFLTISNLVGYGEVSNYGHWAETPYVKGPVSWAPLGRTYADAFGEESGFVMVQIGQREDVWPALRRFLEQRHRELIK